MDVNEQFRQREYDKIYECFQNTRERFISFDGKMSPSLITQSALDCYSQLLKWGIVLDYFLENIKRIEKRIINCYVSYNNPSLDSKIKREDLSLVFSEIKRLIETDKRFIELNSHERIVDIKL